MRVFKHKLGFMDSTDRVEVRDDGRSYLVSQDGWETDGSGYFDLATCLSFVADGDWYEV